MNEPRDVSIAVDLGTGHGGFGGKPFGVMPLDEQGPIEVLLSEWLRAA